MTKEEDDFGYDGLAKWIYKQQREHYKKRMKPDEASGAGKPIEGVRLPSMLHKPPKAQSTMVKKPEPIESAKEEAKKLSQKKEDKEGRLKV